MEYIQLIRHIVLSFPIPDYIFLGTFLSSGFISLFLGASRLYKAIFGCILGLMMFAILNLCVMYLNGTDMGLLNGVKNFITRNREGILIFSMFLIPLFAFIVPFNNFIQFQIKSRNNFLHGLLSFILGVFLIALLGSILITIFNNRFIFSIDYNITNLVRGNSIVGGFFNFMGKGSMFNYLQTYSYLIVFFGFFLIIYKVTFGGLFGFIYSKLKSFINKFEKDKSNNTVESLSDESGGDSDNHEEE